MELVRRWLKAPPMTPTQIESAVAEFFDADADYYPIRRWPEARPCHGRGEITEFYIGFKAAWSRFEYAIRQPIAVGDDRVLVCGSLNAEGQDSGVTVEADLYYCMWLRHGRFFRVEDHSTLGGALHALGLEGETLEAAGLEP